VILDQFITICFLPHQGLNASSIGYAVRRAISSWLPRLEYPGNTSRITELRKSLPPTNFYSEKYSVALKLSRRIVQKAKSLVAKTRVNREQSRLIRIQGQANPKLKLTNETAIPYGKVSPLKLTRVNTNMYQVVCKTFVCTHCGFTTNSQSSYRHHYSQKINKCNRNKFACSLCTYSSVKSSHLRAHTLTHFPPKLQCAKCVRKFRRNNTLLEHISHCH
jgi:hypothetical protein